DDRFGRNVHSIQLQIAIDMSEIIRHRASIARRTRAVRLHCALPKPLHGQARDLPRVLKLQLSLNIRAMRFDSFWAYPQGMGNLPHFVAFADELEDLEFA